MEKFRVVSDLHIDLNDKNLPEFEHKDIFALICGDTSGYPDKSIEYIKKNFPNGLCCSGNHLPYNDYELPVQNLRNDLAKAFPEDSNMTYLDAECGIVSKEVDGILFVGSCFYSDMKIKSRLNMSGDQSVNMMISKSHMNDYRWGISKIENGKYVNMSPADYVEWNAHALKMFDEVIDANEKLENPKPVVVMTHYPLVREVLEHSLYVEKNNFPSYGSDMAWWLEKHPSIKCHCCGHCHDMEEAWRHFKLNREDGSEILVVNNSYGYAHEFHDLTFNPNRFVNVKTWELEELPESKNQLEKKLAKKERLATISMLFGI